MHAAKSLRNLDSPGHDPRRLVNGIVTGQLIKRAIESNILRRRSGLRLQLDRIRILTSRATESSPRTIVVVEAVGEAVHECFFILPASEEIRMETVASRVAVGEHNLGTVGEPVKSETELGADVDDCHGVRGRAHSSLRVAVEVRVRVGHVRVVVVGIEVNAIPAAGEADVASEAFAVESRWDTVNFAASALHEDGCLSKVGGTEGSTFSVAGHDAKAFGRRDGVSHAGAVAGGGSVVGTGVVGVVSGHTQEG